MLHHGYGEQLLEVKHIYCKRNYMGIVFKCITVYLRNNHTVEAGQQKRECKLSNSVLFTHDQSYAP